MRRGLRFPFVFPFLIAIFYFHSLPGIFATIILAMIVIFLFKIFEASNPNNAGQSQQIPYYQPPVQTYYQPSVPTYQPPAQPYQPPYQQEEYKLYEQGYQPSATPYQANNQQSMSATSSYEDYEQPLAQYPEQMPPMEQEQ
jgi:hypothetical protein